MGSSKYVLCTTLKTNEKKKNSIYLKHRSPVSKKTWSNETENTALTTGIN